MGVDVDKCIEQLTQRGELLSESTIRDICLKLKSILIFEPNICQLSSPVTVVGSIHGQFHDLLEIFRVGGWWPDTNYVFTGSYVDGGAFSVETISLILCLRLRYPSRITLLRGSHESRPMNKVYGFYGECILKYGNANVWHYFTDLFDHLSLAATIDNKFFVVHGGISPNVSTLDRIRVLDRFQEVQQAGPIADLVWSDPDPDIASYKAKDIGYHFGGEAVSKFLNENKLNHIVRSHQLCMDGYQVLFSYELATIWSAPNYGYRCSNVAAIMEIDQGGDFLFNLFDSSPEMQLQPSIKDLVKEVPDYFEVI